MDRKKFTAPNQNDLKKAYEDRGKFPDSSNFKDIFTATGAKLVWKMDDRSHKIRILPSLAVDGVQGYGLVVHQHEQVGVNKDKYLCLKRMAKMNCPICEQQAELWESSPEMAKELYPSMRYLMWMVDLTQTPDKQIAKIWSCPKTAMDDILGISYKKSTDEIINLSHPDTGVPVYFDREKVSGSTFSKYKNFQLDDSSLYAEDRWLDGVVSFEDCIVLESYETVKNAFFGTETKKQEQASNKEPSQPEKEEVKATKEEVVNTKPNVDDMERDELEALALTYLSDDYEADEITELGTKKLKRLIKEALSTGGSAESPSAAVKVETTPDEKAEVDTEMSATDALKKRLRERTK